MKKLIRGNTTAIILIVAGTFSLLAYLGLSANVFDALPQADLRLEPAQHMVTVGEKFVINITVESDIPVNVFAGDISFNPEVVKISKIDYNTSIADLWAELPWYHNGEGTLHFAGGTTKPGGFTGEGQLITITFESLNEGSGEIVIKEARILQHDGLGTDAVLKPSIDAIVMVGAPDTQEVLYTSGPRSTYLVTEKPPVTDLNGDGKQTIADTSIFMADLATQKKRSDFNNDGKVSLADLSILLNAE